MQLFFSSSELVWSLCHSTHPQCIIQNSIFHFFISLVPDITWCNSGGGKYSPSLGQNTFELKSVKGRNQVGEIHLMLTSNRPFLLAFVSHDLAAEKGDPPNLSGPDMHSLPWIITY